MIKTPLSTMMGGAFWTPSATILGGASKTFDQLIQSLFANNEQGFFYDPNDPSTMFQDAAGTIPVTGVGQPVGLILDKSGNGNHAYQTTSASRPILRQNATTGVYYLEFDGSDDFLQTSSIDFTSTDKVSLFAGVRKIGTSAAIITELSPNANSINGAFALISNATENSLTLRKRGTGTPSPFVAAIATPFVNPSSVVISSKIDFSIAGVSLRANGNTFNSTGDSGVVSQSINNPIYIGRKGGASLPFNGHIYSLIGVGRLSTDDEITAIEKELAKRTGVTLSV